MNLKIKLAGNTYETTVNDINKNDFLSINTVVSLEL